MINIFRSAFLICFLIAINAFAEDNQLSAPTEESEIIHKIIVKGNQRVETSTIMSYLPFRIGSNFAQDKSDETLKTLYATSLFSKIDIYFNNHAVTIDVQENPIINKIIFEGNDAFKTPDLENELILKPRMVYSKSRIQSDTNRLIEIYNKSGRFATIVTPKIVELPQNRINVVFDIQEGKKATISKIFFVGNKHFSDRKLKEEIMSKEERFWNIFAKTDHYDPDLVDNDKVLLTRFYNSKGYAQFKVISATADIVPSKNTFYLTFTIDEGPKFYFGDMNVTSQIPHMDINQLKSLILTKKGDVFNSNQIDNSIDALTKYLSNHGFPFVQINPNFKTYEDKKIIDVTYEIGKAKRMYIGKITISGNLKTYDYVIRREIRLSEGDPYNAFLIDRSKKRLEGLDFFEKVNIEPQRTNKEDVVDLLVKVQEKSTAQVKFSAGYSTTEGILGLIQFTESNFLGRGQQISAGISRSAASFNTNFGFTEPRFLGNEMSAGFNIFKSSYNNQTSHLGATSNSIPYNTDALGLTLQIGYDIVDDLFHGVSYTIEKDKIYNVNSNAPRYIMAQSGSYIASIVGQRFMYDRTDSPITPTKGYVVRFNQAVAGVGGDTKFFRNIVGATKYFPVMEDVTFKMEGQLANITGYGGKTVKINDRFYLGDQSFRGFQAAGIGPRDILTGDALGGNTYYTGTGEVNFPIGLPKELEVTGAVFTDVGSLWKVDLPKNSSYSSNDFYNTRALRASTGVGVIWITRMGPLRLDFAKAVKKERYDKTQIIHFSFQTGF